MEYEMKENANDIEDCILHINSPLEFIDYVNNSVRDQIQFSKHVCQEADQSYYHGYLFFDLDETLVYKDSSLSEEFACSQQVVQRLCETCLSCCPVHSLADSTERHRYSNDRLILQAMLERIYYAAKLHCIHDLSSGSSQQNESIAQCLADLRDTFTPQIVRVVGITTNRILPYCIKHRSNILSSEEPESASDSDIEDNECAQCGNSSSAETTLPALWQSLYEIDHLQHQIHHIHQIINVLRNSLPNIFGQYLTDKGSWTTTDHHSSTNKDMDFSGTMILPKTKAVVSSVAGVGEIIFRGLNNWTNFSSNTNNTHNNQSHKIRRNKGAILWDYLTTVHSSTISTRESNIVCDIWLIDDTHRKLKSALSYLMNHASAVISKNKQTHIVVLTMQNRMTIRVHMVWFRAVEKIKGSRYRDVVSEVLQYVRYLQSKYAIFDEHDGNTSIKSINDSKSTIEKREDKISCDMGSEKDQWIADYWKQSVSSFQCILQVLEDELR